MRRSRPAPASRANKARSAAKNGLDTPFDTYQKVSPEVGCTKAVTYTHLYRWWPSAIGRWPWGAHTRRMIGFRPMRCSSVAQTSTGVSGCFAASSATTVASFFKRLALLGRGRGRMARARLLHRPVDRLERLPAALRQDRSEPEFARHPGRHFPAGPQAAVGRWLGQARAQALQKLRAQHARYAPVAPAQIAQRLGPVRVVAGEQLLDPARHEARHRRDVRDRVTPR